MYIASDTCTANSRVGTSTSAYGAGLPPIRLHDLRHTSASLALAAGVPMKVVSELLGHSSTVITADTYTSVLPEVASAAAEAVFQIIPRGAADSPPDDDLEDEESSSELVLPPVSRT